MWATNPVISVKNTTLRRVLVELGVIVVGVLIALGVDRLNQRRIDENTEAEYLTALSTDLAEDTASLGSLVRTFAARGAAATRFRRILSSDSLSVADPARLAWEINHAGWVTSFEPTDFTYRELISTGGLALIDDQALKREIVAYYERVQFASQFYPLWQRSAANYRPIVRALLPLDDWALVASSRGPEGEGGLDVAGVLESLRKDGEVQKLLVSIEVAQAQQAETHGDLKTAATELLAYLDAARGRAVP